MKKLILILISTILPLASIFAIHTGRVYVDANKNGVYDKGEKLLKNVMVSDGLNVVVTATDGTFELPGHAKERFIFITTPSGYKTDNAHYRAISDKNKSYDFGLDILNGKINADGSHNFVHIADTEIHNSVDMERWANNVRDYVADEKTAFIMHTGDICYENGLKAHIGLMNTSNMNCPVFYSIGNHDLVKGKYGEELFESIYGPVYFSFNVGNVHYVVTPMAGGDYKPGYTKEDVYRWLKNDLEHVDKNTPVIVFNHDLLSYDDKFIFGINDAEFVDLNAHNLKAWLYGHWHINFVRKQGDVLAISTANLDKGGIDHSTSAYRVVSVDKKGDVKTQLRYTYINNSIQIASIGNERASINANGKIPISVNAYSAVSPARSVSYTCTMDDKKVVSDVALTQNTDWNWSGEFQLPSSAQNRRVFVEAKVVFNNGEVAKTTESFIYQPNEKLSVKTNQDWLTLLNNSAHIGISKDTLSLPLHLSWVTNIKANLFFSSPIIYNNTVYVAAVDEDLRGEGGVYALEATTGKLLWKYNTRNSVKNSIACDNGNIFAQDAEGYLYAIDANSGKLSWEKKLGINGLPALVDGLTANNGTVYAGTGKGFAAYNAKTGNEVWRNEGWGQGEGTTSTPTVGRDVVVSGSQWRGLYGNDAKTGKLLWQHANYGLSSRGASPAIHGGLLYIISGESLFILDVKTGAVVSRKELKVSVDVTSTPLVTDKLIVFGSVDNGLIALDRETLEQKWNVPTLPALIYTAPYTRFPVTTIETSPVLAGSTIFFGASDGILYGVNTSSGKVEWKHATGAPIFSTVAISGNSLFVTDFAGNVYGFSSLVK